METIYQATVQALDIRPCKIVLNEMETASAMRLQSILRRWDMRPCRIVLNKEETESAMHLQFQRRMDIRPCSDIQNELRTESSPTVNGDDRLMLDLDPSNIQCEVAMEQEESEMWSFNHPQLNSTVKEPETTAMNNTDQRTNDMELGFQSVVNCTNQNTSDMEFTTIWNDTPIDVPTETKTAFVEEERGIEAGYANNSYGAKVWSNDPSEYELSNISATKKATNVSTLLLELDIEPDPYERVRASVKDLYPSTVHIYGSRSYNLCDVSSDLNLFIDRGKLSSLQFDMQPILKRFICS